MKNSIVSLFIFVLNFVTASASADLPKITSNEQFVKAVQAEWSIIAHGTHAEDLSLRSEADILPGTYDAISNLAQLEMPVPEAYFERYRYSQLFLLVSGSMRSVRNKTWSELLAAAKRIKNAESQTGFIEAMGWAHFIHYIEEPIYNRPLNPFEEELQKNVFEALTSIQASNQQVAKYQLFHFKRLKHMIVHDPEAFFHGFIKMMNGAAKDDEVLEKFLVEASRMVYLIFSATPGDQSMNTEFLGLAAGMSEEFFATLLGSTPQSSNGLRARAMALTRALRPSYKEYAQKIDYTRFVNYFKILAAESNEATSETILTMAQDSWYLLTKDAAENLLNAIVAMKPETEKVQKLKLVAIERAARYGYSGSFSATLPCEDML